MREELDLLKMVSFGEISTYYLLKPSLYLKDSFYDIIYHISTILTMYGYFFRLWKETKEKRVKLVRKRRRARREARRGKRRKTRI